MKSTGIVRKVDELGRVVIPIELRRVFDIKERDPLEIFVDGEKIILQKFKSEQACIITGEVTPYNQTFGNGLVLSPKGMDILMRELERVMSKL